jgi:hypothetical protein
MSQQHINSIRELRAYRHQITAIAQQHKAQQIQIFGSAVCDELTTERLLGSTNWGIAGTWNSVI